MSEQIQTTALALKPETDEPREPMTLEKFIAHIKIDGGFYPFSLFEVTANNELHIYGLALPSVQLVYNVVNQALNKVEQPKQMFLAVDFPASLDVPTDFVGVFYFNENDLQWSSVLLPYDKDSNRLPEVNSGEMHKLLTLQINACCPIPMIINYGINKNVTIQ